MTFIVGTIRMHTEHPAKLGRKRRKVRYHKRIVA